VEGFDQDEVNEANLVTRTIEFNDFVGVDFKANNISAIIAQTIKNRLELNNKERLFYV
jgi:hypothetical protein